MGAAEVAVGLLIAVVALPLLLGITAIAAGVAARKRIRRTGGELTGGGLALAGIICGSISLVLSIGFLTLVLLAALGSAPSGRRARKIRVRTAVQTAPATRAVPAPVPPAPPAPSGQGGGR